MINNTPELTVIAYYLVTRGWTPLIEQEMSNWGAYSPGEGRGLENPLIQSLLKYGQLVLAQPDPKHYVQRIIASLGYYEDKYRRLIEA